MGSRPADGKGANGIAGGARTADGGPLERGRGRVLSEELRTVATVLTGADYDAGYIALGRSLGRNPIVRRNAAGRSIAFGTHLFAGGLLVAAAMSVWRLYQGIPAMKAWLFFLRVSGTILAFGLAGALVWWISSRLWLGWKLRRLRLAQRRLHAEPLAFRFGWNESHVGSFTDGKGKSAPIAALNGWDDLGDRIILYVSHESLLPLPLRDFSDEEKADLRRSLAAAGLPRGFQPLVREPRTGPDDYDRIFG